MYEVAERIFKFAESKIACCHIDLILKDMKQQKESSIKNKLTIEQVKQIMAYPCHWRDILTKAAKRGESIEKVYKELKDFESFM